MQMIKPPVQRHSHRRHRLLRSLGHQFVSKQLAKSELIRIACLLRCCDSPLPFLTRVLCVSDLVEDFWCWLQL